MWDKQRGEGAECEQVDCFKMRVERKLKEHGRERCKDARRKMQDAVEYAQAQAQTRQRAKL